MLKNGRIVHPPNASVGYAEPSMRIHAAHSKVMPLSHPPGNGKEDVDAGCTPLRHAKHCGGNAHIRPVEFSPTSRTSSPSLISTALFLLCFVLHIVQDELTHSHSTSSPSSRASELHACPDLSPFCLICPSLFFLLFFLVTFLFFFFLSILFCFPHFILIANYSFHQKIKIYFLFSLLLYFLFFFVPSPFRVSSTLRFLFFPAVDLSPESC